MTQPSQSTRVHAVVLLIALAWAAASSDPRVLASVGLAAFALKLYVERAQWLADGFGLPNAVTTARLTIIGTMGFALHADGLVLALMALAVFALDGIDGWLARTLDRATPFGAEYDKEADAFYVAVVGLLLFCRDVAPWWSLVPGFLRYVYVLAVAVMPARGEVPRTTIARYSFAILATSFTASFVLPPIPARVSVAIGTLVVCWSFGRSFVWSLRLPRAGSID